MRQGIYAFSTSLAHSWCSMVSGSHCVNVPFAVTSKIRMVQELRTG